MWRDRRRAPTDLHWSMINHETTLKNHGNQPKTMKNHETEKVMIFRQVRGVTTDLLDVWISYIYVILIIIIHYFLPTSPRRGTWSPAKQPHHFSSLLANRAQGGDVETPLTKKYCFFFSKLLLNCDRHLIISLNAGLQAARMTRWALNVSPPQTSETSWKSLRIVSWKERW